MKKKLVVIISAVVLALCLSVTAFANLKGDVDGKDGITVSDARLCLRQAIKLETYTPDSAEFKACDVDGDNAVTVSDARLILRYAIKLDTSFPAKDEEPETKAPEETTKAPEETTKAPEETTKAPEETTAHTHAWDKGTVTKAATCKAEGVKTYKCACGETKTESIAVIPHTLVADKAVAPTCTKEGKTEGEHCSVCGEVTKAQSTVAALGHDYKAVVTAPNCTASGYTTYTCTVCKEAYTDNTVPAKGHTNGTPVKENNVEATCTTAGGYDMVTYCTDCKTKVSSVYTAVDALGHDFSKENVTAPTCNEQGYTTKVCSRCQTASDEKINITEPDSSKHVWKTDTVKATCLAEGYTVNKCENCDQYDSASYVAGDPATGHNWASENKDATCESPALVVNTCSVCQAVETVEDETHPALGHEYKWTVTKAATCTEEGSRNGVCSRCNGTTTEATPYVDHISSRTVIKGSGDTYCSTEYKCSMCGMIFRTVENSGHNLLKDNKSTVAATCTEAGSYKRYCRYCNYTDKIENIEPLGHNVSIDTNRTVLATCTEDGHAYYSGTCSRCNESFDNNTVIILPARGHINVAGDIADCENAVTCDRCKEVISPALGHDYSVKAEGSFGESFFCSRCGKVRTDALAHFNSLANAAKKSSYINAGNKTITWVGSQKTTTDYKKFDFGMYTSTIKSMYEEEMGENNVEYSILRENDPNYFDMPVRYMSFASLLTDSDIDSIKVERVAGLTGAQLFSEYPTSYTKGKTEYSLAKYKTDTKLADELVKVTVDVKNETFTKDSAITKVNYDRYNEKTYTTMQKFYHYDVRDDLKEYDSNWKMVENEEGEGYSINMDMTLNSVKSDGQVVYYFNAKTMEPVAAVYTVSNSLDQTVNMNFKVAVMSINGVIQPVITTTQNYIYLFTDSTTK